MLAYDQDQTKARDINFNLYCGTLKSIVFVYWSLVRYAIKLNVLLYTPFYYFIRLMVH